MEKPRHSPPGFAHIQSRGLPGELSSVRVGWGSAAMPGPFYGRRWGCFMNSIDERLKRLKAELEKQGVRRLLIASELGCDGRILEEKDVIRLLKSAIEREGDQVAFARHHGIDRGAAQFLQGFTGSVASLPRHRPCEDLRPL
jgi:hypothetical protein